eukprot:scaffold50191_cov65-Phaeocystis_antarctica.AAC.2
MVYIADPGPAGYSGSEWSQQGKAVSEGYSRPSARMSLGVPAYDLRRFTEGPSLYINGTPDAGSKKLFATEVQAMRHGRFATGNASRGLTSSFKVDCRKSKSGPDPYNVNNSDLWSQHTARKGSPRFAVENGESRTWTPPRSACSRSLNLDPYSLGSRDNPWKTFGRVASARAPASTSRGSSPRSTRSTAGYFSPFPESLNIGSRAHTPRGAHMSSPISAATTRMASPTGRRNLFSGGNTEPIPFASKDWGGVSPGGLSSPATLPPLPAACRL